MYEPYPPSFSGLSPLSSKQFCIPCQVTQILDGPTPPLNKWGWGGGSIVGKGGHTSPFLDQSTFSKISPFLEIRDVPTFHRSIGKTKELNNSCNQFVYNFYPQSILILEECLQNW